MQEQTVQLMRILLVGTLIFSVSGIVMGILQSFNHFLLPALAPIMYDLGILFGVVFLIKPFGVYGIAHGRGTRRGDASADLSPRLDPLPRSLVSRTRLA